MLTSEQQKIYNVKVPKGGYGYYTLYHGIYDPENDIDERPSYAQTGDLFEPEGSSVVYKAIRKNGKTTWAIAEDAQRQSESGEGGSGGGSSLPSMTGKNGKVLGVTLDAQDHEQAEWVTPSGGGAEKFIVTLTQDEQTEEWTADKTAAEIVAAYDADQVVVCRVPFEDYNAHAEIPCWFAGENFASFGGLITFDNPLNVEAQIFADGNDTEVLVRTVPIPTSTNAPLIVTLTAGQTEGQFVGDKTHEEVFNAFVNGQNCVFYAPSVGLAETVKAAEHVTDYAINTGSFTSSGSASDYITVTVGG